MGKPLKPSDIDNREHELSREAKRVTSVSEFFLDISKGLVEGHKIVIMQGRNPEINAGESTDIWDVGGDINIPTSAITLFISSTDSDTEQIVIQGLDSDFNEQTGFATLNGQNQVEVKNLAGDPITFLRFFAAINFGTSSLLGDIYISESDTLTSGKPDTSTKIQGKICIGNERTFNAFYTVPAGKSLVTTSTLFSVARGKDVLIGTQTRPLGKTFISGVPFNIFESIFTFIQPIFPPIIPEKTDLKLNVTANADFTQTSVRIDFVQIDN